jgi:hypothetical protein
VEAVKSFATAITHLSNTVEDDHPGLMQARKLASGASDGAR